MMSENKYIKFSELNLKDSHVTLPTHELERFVELLQDRDKLIDGFENDDKVVRVYLSNSPRYRSHSYYIDGRVLDAMERDVFEERVEEIVNRADELVKENNEYGKINLDLQDKLINLKSEMNSFNKLPWYKKITFKFKTKKDE